MNIIDSSDVKIWNDIVTAFNNTDIYYLNEYTGSLLTQNSNLRAVLFHFEGKKSSMCYPMIISDLADMGVDYFDLQKNCLYDMETPYGYGGFLFDNLDNDDLMVFKEELKEWCIGQNIVSQFIRFNPMLNNIGGTETFFDEVRYLHHTVAMDTSDGETIIKNMDSKNRNMIRKAMKNNVNIVIDDNLSGLEEFKEVYRVTMDYHNADNMYYFTDDYYTYLNEKFKDHTILFRAVYEGKTVSAALFFYNENYMHYHLSGTIPEFRNLAASNLILYTAACWAAEHGITKFHLGGGMEENDSLFGFKKQFNKNGYCDFWIGKSVFLPEKYEMLLDLRCERKPEFNRNNNRLIQYRT